MKVMKAIITPAQFDLAKETLHSCCSANPDSVKEMLESLDIDISTDKNISLFLTDFQVVWLVYAVLNFKDQKFDPEVLKDNFQQYLSSFKPQLLQENYSQNYKEEMFRLMTLNILLISSEQGHSVMFILNRQIVTETSQDLPTLPKNALDDEYDNLDMQFTMHREFSSPDRFRFQMQSPTNDYFGPFTNYQNPPLPVPAVIPAPVNTAISLSEMPNLPKPYHLSLANNAIAIERVTNSFAVINYINRTEF
jgi:hypothetical protein